MGFVKHMQRGKNNPNPQRVINNLFLRQDKYRELFERKESPSTDCTASMEIGAVTISVKVPL